MSRFDNFNPENKLRIPLSWYAAHTIDADCMNFSIKKTTLMNTIIEKYSNKANCTIGLRLEDYKKELLSYLKKSELHRNEAIIQSILSGREHSLIIKYARRFPSDVNWQITLNKKVKHLLTEDPSTFEEKYYGSKPGHYVRALIEEYTRLPYYKREEIVFNDFLEKIKDAIKNEYSIKLLNNKGTYLIMKPYSIETDPLSMYHYVIGYVSATPLSNPKTTVLSETPKVQSLRVARLIDVEVQRFQPANLSEFDKSQILKELEQKSVQFVSGNNSNIRIWLSDNGIKNYKSRIHLRPFGVSDPDDPHIFSFECTENQILYYFLSFGADAKILFPKSLADKFRNCYKSAMTLYES